MTRGPNQPSNEAPNEVMIVAGEASGDAHAAELLTELRQRHPDVHFFGCGGDHMAAAGCELLVSTRDLAVMGLVEVVAHLPRLYGHLRRLRRALRQRRPRAIILVDFPDFNLRLASVAHAAGIPAIYFISPQLWAWRSGRVRQIRRHVRRMICIFPFEPAFYAAHGVEVDYVGHPMIERVPLPTGPRAPDLVALLPGSRRREVAMHLPFLLAAAASLHADRGVRFALPVAPGLDPAVLTAMIPSAQRDYIELVPADRLHAVVGQAQAAIVASGTATVETALLGTPMVVVYRVSPWTYRLGRRLVKTTHVAMVNLIAEGSGAAPVPELIQHDFTPDCVVSAVAPLLSDSPTRRAQLATLTLVRKRLGQPGAIARAADAADVALARNVSALRSA